MAGGSKEPCLGSFSCHLPWDATRSSGKKLSTSNSENYLNDDRNFQSFNFIAARDTFALEEIFHLIRKLRLSHADIIRCMNLDVPLSHLNGFFLHLRLGKLDTGLGGTGYYAACITGEGRENIGCRSILVVDVGVCISPIMIFLRKRFGGPELYKLVARFHHWMS